MKGKSLIHDPHGWQQQPSKPSKIHRDQPWCILLLNVGKSRKIHGWSWVSSRDAHHFGGKHPIFSHQEWRNGGSTDLNWYKSWGKSFCSNYFISKPEENWAKAIGYPIKNWFNGCSLHCPSSNIQDEGFSNNNGDVIDFNEHKTHRTVCMIFLEVITLGLLYGCKPTIGLWVSHIWPGISLIPDVCFTSKSCGWPVDSHHRLCWSPRKA